MKEVRKQLDFAADFLIFVTACFFALSGCSQITAMQDTLHRGLVEKGMEQVAEYTIS